MISFIIIGRNEGLKLKKCIESVFNTIQQNHIEEYEVIYVDSNSNDNTFENKELFKNVKTYLLTKDMNAAIARNLGAAKSKGDVLFFIDGDMEIMPSFLPLVYSSKKGLCHQFVSGNWINYIYDNYGNLLEKKLFKNLKSDSKESVTGGLFLIKRKTWDSVNGMRQFFKKSQDIDLGLRLAKKGIYLLRKKEVAAKHHTIAYLDNQRIWRELFNGKHLYGRSLLYRKHIFNRHIYKRIIGNEKSLILLVVLLIISLIINNFLPLVLYFPFILLRKGVNLKLFTYMIIRDVLVLFGLCFFFPKKHFTVDYKTINNESK